MATRRPNPRPRHERAGAIPADWGERLERAAVGLAVLLTVARPAFPSEDAETGSGLVVVALWGLVAVIWAAAHTAREQVRWYASWFDVLPAALLAIVVASACWADIRRPAINMASEWGGLLLSYFLVRQLFRDPARQRLLVVAMLATAATLAAYGIYQAFWGLEATRAEYAQNRLRLLQELNIAPGSPSETTFTNRLNSHEPFATFALANSLAGFLVAWLPLGVAWLLAPFVSAPIQQTSPATSAHRFNRGRMLLQLGSAAAILAMVICLVLTQSRTAYVGLLVELVLLAILFGRRLLDRWRAQFSDRVLWAAGIGVVVTLAGVLIASVARGKIDEKLITQATKSFEYRWEYWQATTRLIVDRLWTGTGPGNFRGHYLAHKLAESSEEIADPHNFVLEVCATSGVLAGLALVATLIVASSFMWRAGGDGPRVHEPMDWLVLGAAGFGGFGLAALLSAAEPSLHASLMIVWAVAAAIFSATHADWKVRPRVVACAIAGLAIHLLGAGGIGMPGVAQSLWVLLAVGLNSAESRHEPCTTHSKLLARVALLVSVGALACFAVFVLRPVTASQSAISSGRSRLASRDWAGAEGQFQAAAKFDPVSAEPWIELTRIYYERWRQEQGRGGEEKFGQAVRAAETAIRLAPSSLEPYSLMAGLWEARSARDEQFWPNSAEAYRRCVENYPTSATLHARLANSLWRSGAHDAARHVMKRALELDSLTSHLDKKLAKRDRDAIESRFIENSPDLDGSHDDK
jgi:hypothetical protein